MRSLTRIIMAAAALVLPVASYAERFDATVVAGHPAVFRWVQMLDLAFIPEVNRALEGSGHSLDFMPQYGGAIAKVGDELETIEFGLAELGLCFSLFDPAKLALQNVTYYTPFVTDDSSLVSEVMQQLHLSEPRMTEAYAENGVVYLGAPIGIDDYLVMTNFPFTSMADLEGRKIAAPGSAVNWLSGTGAIGVSGNLTTYYNEMQTGVYDGVLVFASAALPGKLYEVAPYVTQLGLGAQFAGALCANVDWYESLPEAVQNALHSGADHAGDWYNRALEDAVAASLTGMADAGATVTEASAELRSQWAMGMDNAAQNWAETLDAQGLPGSEILSVYMNAMRDAGAVPLRQWDQE